MMNAPQKNKSVIIIGAGIAGLSAGIFAQKNGYQSRIYEMHNLPGGLMTGWRRKGYTIEGCIHWLTGSKPGSEFYTLWEAIGLIQDRIIFNPEVFSQIEDTQGNILTLYTDVDRLEKHLLVLSRTDEKLIRKICSAIRAFADFPRPVNQGSGFFNNAKSKISHIPKQIKALPHLIYWGNKTIAEMGSQFKDPFLHKVFSDLWYPQMSAVTILFTMAYLHTKSAGYPLGGSLPMASAIEKRYGELGGEIHYGKKVQSILVKNNQAVGIQLADGTVENADFVISAADGFTTIFEMLSGQYVDQKIKDMYNTGVLFPAILFVGIGVNRTFEDLPKATSGMVIYLNEPMEITGKRLDRIEFRVYNFDPTLAPQGKTLITVTISTSYEYWKNLTNDRAAYEDEKQKIGKQVIKALETRFPGLSAAVEMMDVSTPHTFERYTGNWQASYEGWLPTPKMVMLKIPKKLPGLENFYMAGQWVQAGGGLPSGVTTARDVIEQINKENKKH